MIRDGGRARERGKEETERNENYPRMSRCRADKPWSRRRMVQMEFDVKRKLKTDALDGGAV